jgi:hypothetical protein
MVTSPAGLRNKSDLVGEGQQQFTELTGNCWGQETLGTAPFIRFWNITCVWNDKPDKELAKSYMMDSEQL